MKAIIFDLDGTLIRLPIDYPRLLQRLQKLFGTQKELKPLMPTITKLANKNDSMLKNAFQIMTDEELIAINNFEIIRDAQDILVYFKEHRFMIGLMTMQGRRVVEEILNKFAPSIFDYIITRDERNDRFEQIQKILQDCALDPNQTIVVGDRIYDAECAKKSGCTSILFKENPTDYNDSKVITSLSELKSLV